MYVDQKPKVVPFFSAVILVCHLLIFEQLSFWPPGGASAENEISLCKPHQIFIFAFNNFFVRPIFRGAISFKPHPEKQVLGSVLSMLSFRFFSLPLFESSQLDDSLEPVGKKFRVGASLHLEGQRNFNVGSLYLVKISKYGKTLIYLLLV